jgi:formylglycine-generating enzyme required for sulfatase activity
MIWQPEQLLRNGTYKIDRELGRGGFGITYLAQDLALKCPVVIKSPHMHLCKDPSYAAYLDRFSQEGSRLANLKRHPNVVRVAGFFPEQEMPCLVMDFVEGETLTEKVQKQGAIPEAIVVPWMIAIAEALVHVHGEGLVHRDANPANIIIQPDGQPMLIDFGIALEIQPCRTTTMAGLGGHRDFAPYEQLAKKSGSRQLKVDIYCVAATLYYAITGQLPEGAYDRKIAIQEGQDCLIPPQKLKPEITDRIHHAILSGMEMDPEDRPESMQNWITLLTTDDGLLTAIRAPSIAELPLQPLTFQTIALDEKATVIDQPTRSMQYFDELLSEGITMRMMLVPSGSFVMGSPEEELHSYNNEKPQHLVTVPDFAIGQFTITQTQWTAIAQLPKVKRNLKPKPSFYIGNNRPAERLNWDEAVEFCDRLTRLTRKPYRLPSEAEWEYACRAGTTTAFNLGPTIATDFANYRGVDDDRGEQGVLLGNYGEGPQGAYRGKTIEMGEFFPNPFGLYDMHGNVWEWCADHWHQNYDGAPIDGSVWLDPEADESGDRVIRGGSWTNSPQSCRSVSRFSVAPDYRNNSLGFRVLCRPVLQDS